MQNGLVVVAENVENGINGRVVRAFRRRHVHAFSPVSFHFLGIPSGKGGGGRHEKRAGEKVKGCGRGRNGVEG